MNKNEDRNKKVSNKNKVIGWIGCSQNEAPEVCCNLSLGAKNNTVGVRNFKKCAHKSSYRKPLKDETGILFKLLKISFGSKTFLISNNCLVRLG